LIQRLTSFDPDRLGRLAAVHRAAFAPTSRGWSGAEIESLARNGALYADDVDRGFALFSVAMDEAELLTVAVNPDDRRTGLGNALLTTGEADLRLSGITKIYLEVAADNIPAAALYAALGYQTAGIRKGYYSRSDGVRVDAVMMMKGLSGSAV
jgi:[ribosomal protein S18]-alanine N-acetyltransferase